MTPRTLGLTDPIYQYVMQVGFREPQPLKLVREQTAPLPGAHMMIAPEQAQFMALLTRLLGVRRYLEIGTYTGYSALAVALAMEADGRVVTCEIDEEIATTAKRHWRDAGIANKIELRLAPALETLNALLAPGKRGHFDMAFIDADKENLLAYYECCHALVRVGGVILVDNTLWGGSVAEIRSTIHRPRRSEPSTISFTRISVSRWCCCPSAMA